MGDQALVALTATNPHDNGYDLTPGDDATNPRVGWVYWDGQDPDASGLVVSFDANSPYLPDDVDEAVLWLASQGYRLDARSVEQVAGLNRAFHAPTRGGA
ncbi:MAG: hypothetical protein M3Z33_07920 [Actinomycetota bacterium]|nr:hypothetical protein [Actinomycetota bacterium]